MFGELHLLELPRSHTDDLYHIATYMHTYISTGDFLICMIMWGSLRLAPIIAGLKLRIHELWMQNLPLLDFHSNYYKYDLNISYQVYS